MRGVHSFVPIIYLVHVGESSLFKNFLKNGFRFFVLFCFL